MRKQYAIKSSAMKDTVDKIISAVSSSADGRASSDEGWNEAVDELEEDVLKAIETDDDDDEDDTLGIADDTRDEDKDDDNSAADKDDDDEDDDDKTESAEADDDDDDDDEVVGGANLRMYFGGPIIPLTCTKTGYSTLGVYEILLAI